MQFEKEKNGVALAGAEMEVSFYVAKIGNK